MKKYILFALLAIQLTACSGIQKTDKMFTTHAESVNLLGFEIPENSYKKAEKLVPAGAKINSINAKPNDWSSVLGVINRIIGVSYTEISGEVSVN